MKTNQVNAILTNQAKRKSKIINYTCVIIVFSILFLAFLLLFINNNKNRFINYTEESALDYKVYLNDNNFFKENFLEKDNQYIASLINYISADFNYNLEVPEKDINYKYTYTIESNVKVIEKSTNKNLYNYSEELIKKELTKSNSNSKVEINHNINIDYNKYNDLISNFVDVYELEDIESTLTINMYVNVIGDCEDIADSDTESVISLSIPLTTNTIGIDMSYDLVNSDDEKIMICTNINNTAIIFLSLSLLMLLIIIILVITLIKFIITTRTAESIYEKELKKILNNYKSYIQKVNNGFDMTGYQVLKVDTFTDMLEIRDTIQEPILMVENKEKTAVYFLVPSKTKLLYSYGFKISDIKSKLRGDENEKI